MFLRTCVLALSAVIGLVVSATAAGGSFAEPTLPGGSRNRLVIPQFSGTARLGTDLHQAPWNAAARLEGFLKLNSRKLAVHPTSVYACYDRSALWLAFRCEGIDGRTAKVEARERDGRVWWDDAVEFYCSPDHSRLHFLQFAANAAGVAYDGKGSDGSWDARWQVESSVDAEGFTVAMRLPFPSLGIRLPKPGTSWRVNFSRQGPVSGSSAWVWSYNGLHDPRQFGDLIFGGPDVTRVRVRDISAWTIGRNVVVLEQPEGLRCRFAARDVNGAPLFESIARPEGNQYALFLENDGVRTLEAQIEDENEQVLARWWSDVHSPELTPRLIDWVRRFEILDRMTDRFPQGAGPAARELIEAGKPLLASARRIVADKSAYSAERWQELETLLDKLDKKLGNLSGYARTLEYFPHAAFAVGLESPMRKVMIRDFPFQGEFDRQAAVSLAGNETEAVQVVVMPFRGGLNNVRVEARMTGPREFSQGAETIGCQVSLVGHVDVEDDPPYASDYKGFWPDPLLSFQQTADVKDGEHVSFWVDVTTGKTTPPGEYEGRIDITADGCSPMSLPLKVQVWDFVLPDGTHLRNAFTYHQAQIGGIHGNRWNSEMAQAYQDLILDHRLGIDHLYRREPPDLGMIQRAVGKGMNAFNIMFAGSGGRKQAVLNAMKDYVPRIERAGLLDLAYLYGFDEIKADKFEAARDLFESVKRSYPGIPTMTTAADPSFGTESGLRSAVDIWVPLTPHYDLAAAEELRREGKQMWWYVCLVPVAPYANWFIEYPAIESRLLMGAMSYKYRVDGFLYYLINNGWERNKKVISSGPYTEWNPGSCQNSKGKWANGDGNLIYPGPAGPLSSIRLANIRDGLEDYEYLYLLAQRVREVEALPTTPVREKFLAAARPLLTVPSAVVRNVVEYTYNPSAVAQWRTQMAELIVAAPELGQARQ